MLLEQEEQALCYTSEEYVLDEDDDVTFDLKGDELFRVKRRRDTGSKENVGIASDGSIESFESPSDFALDNEAFDFERDVFQSRITTVEDCTCQFNKAFPGMPCRHILHICFKKDVSTYCVDCIDAKYLAMDEAFQKRQLYKLYSTPAPPMLQKEGQRAQQITKGERHALLLREFNAIVDVATHADQQTFENVLHKLSESFRALQESMTSRPRPVAPPAPPPVAPSTAATSTTAATTSVIKESPTDIKDLNGRLHMEERLLPVPDKLDVSTVLGKRVAVKWLPKTQGGWFTGQVVKVIDPQKDSISDSIPHDSRKGTCNVEVVYDAVEGDTTELHRGAFFHHSNMVNVATASIHSWGLIEHVGLSNLPAHQPPANPLQQVVKTGRKQSKRKGPAGGGPLGTKHAKSNNAKSVGDSPHKQNKNR